MMSMIMMKMSILIMMGHDNDDSFHMNSQIKQRWIKWIVKSNSRVSPKQRKYLLTLYFHDIDLLARVPQNFGVKAENHLINMRRWVSDKLKMTTKWSIKSLSPPHSHPPHYPHPDHHNPNHNPNHHHQYHHHHHHYPHPHNHVTLL